MEIKTLTLKNFQGHKDLTIDFGKRTTICGKNMLGKTTIANAIYWLFFNRPADDSKNFNPKPFDSNGDNVHYLDSVVNAVIDTGDGTSDTITKTQSENWTKKRGSTVATFTGHVITYTVNTIPKTEKEFNTWVSEHIAPQDQMRLLMTSDYFARMDWKDRRTILTETFGNISDADVIAANLVKYGELSEPLKKHSVDDLKKILKNELNLLNREIDELPGRIDEINRGIVPVNGTEEELNAKISEIGNQMEIIKMAAVKTIDDSHDIKIQSLKNSLRTAENEYLAQVSEENKTILSQRSNVASERNDVESEINSLLRQNKMLQSNIQDMQEMKANLLARYNEVFASQWNGDTVCPTCGQPLPADKIENARAAFNFNKSQELEVIDRKGKERCSEKLITDTQTDINNNVERVKALEKRLKDIDAVVGNMLLVQPNFAATKVYQEFTAQIDAEERTKAANAAQADNSSGEQIAALKGQRAVLQREVFTIDNNAELVRRANEYQDRLNSINSECESKMRTRDLLEQFTVDKMNMLIKNINSEFPNNVYFKLFDKQINGGIAEVCDIYINTNGALVPWASANNAGRINAGIDIIRVLSNKWNINVPVIIDNTESVNKVVDSGSQEILLRVTNDERLNIIQG